MKNEFFLSQRLGFTNAQADKILQFGVEHFVELSFKAPYDFEMPTFMENAPKSRKEFRNLKAMNEDQKKLLVVNEVFKNASLAHWWRERMYTNEYPLREKMTLFWHNHFVSGFKKVKSSWAMYNQNNLFREHAFGNFKELTQLILTDNAMLIYLDNVKNKASAPNENLSRELLELFTIGVGNYSENDVKEGAKALAGLNIGEDGGKYYPKISDNSTKTYLGKTGNWKANDIVDIIFAHPKAAHRITEKLLNFFVTDTPSVNWVNEYAEFLKKENFELKPFLQKMVRDDRFLKSQGQKIKDPMTFILQAHHEFQLELPSVKRLAPYFNQQGMVLFNPPNVKGWDGGKTWLSSQKLLQRMAVIATMSNGKALEHFKFKTQNKQDEALDEVKTTEEQALSKKNNDALPIFRWDKSAKNNKDIIKNVAERLLFAVSNDMQQDMERILKYDFDPTQMNAQNGVTRLAEYAMKSPEFQIY